MRRRVNVMSGEVVEVEEGSAEDSELFGPLVHLPAALPSLSATERRQRLTNGPRPLSHLSVQPPASRRPPPKLTTSQPSSSQHIPPGTPAVKTKRLRTKKPAQSWQRAAAESPAASPPGALGPAPPPKRPRPPPPSPPTPTAPPVLSPQPLSPTRLPITSIKRDSNPTKIPVEVQSTHPENSYETSVSEFSEKLSSIDEDDDPSDLLPSTANDEAKSTEPGGDGGWAEEGAGGGASSSGSGFGALSLSTASLEAPEPDVRYVQSRQRPPRVEQIHILDRTDDWGWRVRRDDSLEGASSLPEHEAPCAESNTSRASAEKTTDGSSGLDASALSGSARLDRSSAEFQVIMSRCFPGLRKKEDGHEEEEPERPPTTSSTDQPPSGGGGDGRHAPTPTPVVSKIQPSSSTGPSNVPVRTRLPASAPSDPPSKAVGSVRDESSKADAGPAGGGVKNEAGEGAEGWSVEETAEMGLSMEEYLRGLRRGWAGIRTGRTAVPCGVAGCGEDLSRVHSALLLDRHLVGHLGGPVPVLCVLCRSAQLDFPRHAQRRHPDLHRHPALSRPMRLQASPRLLAILQRSIPQLL